MRKRDEQRQERVLLTALGDHIRMGRENCGFSQREVAKKAGISRSHLSDIELARTKITIPKLRELCSQLRLHWARVLTGAGRAAGILQY